MKFTYDDSVGNFIVTSKTHRVGNCPESFYNTEYEKKFYNVFKDAGLLCVDDKEFYVQGTRDSRVLGKNHAFVMYEFLKCTEETREETRAKKLAPSSQNCSKYGAILEPSWSPNRSKMEAEVDVLVWGAFGTHFGSILVPFLVDFGNFRGRFW